MSRIRFTSLSCVLLAALAATLAFPAVASAQQSARIYGVVTDSDGEPVPDASIVVEFQGGGWLGNSR